MRHLFPVRQHGGVSTFNSSAFFRLDGEGWGNSGTSDDGVQHNYGLTTELHLDASAAKLGIQKGKSYSMDLFHTERHTTASNFRVDTNFVFMDCGFIIP